MQFLQTLGILGPDGKLAPLDAVKALTLYRDRFFERVVDVEQRFERLVQIFNYQYRRRNLYLTFLLSLAVAVALGLPTQAIYQRAKAMSPEETAALVATAQALYQRADSMARVADTTGTAERFGHSRRCEAGGKGARRRRRGAPDRSGAPGCKVNLGTTAGDGPDRVNPGAGRRPIRCPARVRPRLRLHRSHGLFRCALLE